ncbi:MAG: hypothetical protein HFJ59_03700 [Clostridia bacterium]|nr:hypothetical protein [Clostridia bacterium]
MSEEKKSNIKSNSNTKKSYLNTANYLTFLNHVEHSDLYNQLSDKYIKNEIEFSEIEYTIKNYYHSLHDINSNIKKQRECDLICFRIAYLLENKSFVLNPIVFKNIHKFIYKDIFEFCGNYREYNISQKESLSNHYPINFIDSKDISKSLIYIFNRELSYDYSSSNQDDMVKNFAQFFSDIWEIHPFLEGNTCSSTVFIIKYLTYLGFNLNFSAFEDNGTLCKNGLIKSIYNNFPMDIYANFDLLISFFNILLNFSTLNLTKNGTDTNHPKLSVKIQK